MSINLSIAKKTSLEPRYRLNEVALKDVLSMVEQINGHVQCDPPRPEGLLSLKGVLEQIDEDPDEAAEQEFKRALVKSYEELLTALIEARQKEGEALADVLSKQLDEVEKLVAAAKAGADKTPGAIKDRISKQIEQLLDGAGIAEDRLAQEAAILAVKADIREELDRLDAHLETGRALLTKPGAMGRQFDFLTQEFNREANTLCSKVPEIALKKIGLDLKNVIDQMREQVQNVE